MDASKDHEIWSVAKQDDGIILTKDEDFVQLPLSIQQGHPWSGCGSVTVGSNFCSSGSLACSQPS